MKFWVKNGLMGRVKPAQMVKRVNPGQNDSDFEFQMSAAALESQGRGVHPSRMNAWKNPGGTAASSPSTAVPGQISSSVLALRRQRRGT